MKKLAIMISSSLLMASTAVSAQAYLGGKLGTTWLDKACVSGSTCDDQQGSFGAFLGYNANDWFAIEAGYDYLGKYTAAGLNDEKVTAITLAPKFSLGLTEKVALFAKVGGAYVDYGSKDDYSFLGAAGLELKALDNLAVRAEYQLLTDINNDLVRAKANSFSVGVSYLFGQTSAPVTPVAKPADVAPVEVTPEPEVVVVEETVVEDFPVFVDKVYQFQKLDSSNFAVNSSKLNESSYEVLDELVVFMNRFPQSEVVITGHTDSTGAAAYNQKLSEQRAKAVADVVISKGIDAQRITWQGKGQTQPIAPNNTVEGRDQNRRVDIVIPEFEYQVKAN